MKRSSLFTPLLRKPEAFFRYFNSSAPAMIESRAVLRVELRSHPRRGRARNSMSDHAALRRDDSGSRPSPSSRQVSRVRARRRTGFGAESRRSTHRLNTPANKPCVGFLIKLDEARIDARFDGTLAQQTRAESVDRANEGQLQIGRGLSRLPQFLAQAQFHFTGCSLGKGYSDHAGEFRSGGNATDDLLDKLSRLACACRRFQEGTTGTLHQLERAFGTCQGGSEA